MLRSSLSCVLASVAMVFGGASMSLASFEAEAKRLGSGRPAGMQRQAPAKQADNAAPASPNAAPNASPNAAPGKPAQAAAPTGAAAAQAAQPARRSWMGPIAGLAAGLGLAALASHLGFGEELANFMMLALLAVVALVVVAWVMRRMRGAAAASGPQLAGAGAPVGGGSAGMLREAPAASQPWGQATAPLNREGHGLGAAGAFGAGAPASPVASLPAGFDAEGFTRLAKMVFIRLQAANDAGNVDDLRKFTTPELFASLRLDLQERGTAAQQTDVVQLDAELVEAVQEQGQWVASVRFHGLIREEASQGAEPFNELWHLVRPLDDSREWAIAGITPLQV